MEKNGLTLIIGGKNEETETKLSFISAKITDTRLMGVIYLYVLWLDRENIHHHMFFYLDAEETGFEEFKSVTGDDSEKIFEIENRMAGCLGGKMIPVNEKEACAILCEYADFNRKHGLKLPVGADEYGFMLNNENLSEKEKRVLLSKQCTVIRSDYEVINYFLMRCFGHDFDMAMTLAYDEISPDIYTDYKKATFYRNEISDSGKGTYICESLVESGNRYSIIVSEVAVRDGKVIFFENKSKMAITAIEAAMILSKAEYVNCYEILTDPDTFEKAIQKIAVNSMVTVHESGSMYMMFNDNNNHVNSRIFRIKDDVFGLYYVTRYGQLIAAAYSEENINRLHERLRRNIGGGLAIAGTYEFVDSIIYDFVQSGADDFETFIDFMSEE